MKLSRAKLRSHVFGEYGIQWYLSYDKVEARRNTSLAIISSHIVDEAITAFFAGCHDESQQLIVLAKDWLETAINEGEVPQQLAPYTGTRYTPNYHEAQTYTLLGLCLWLTGEGFSQSAFQTAGQFAFDYCSQHPADFWDHGILRYLLLAGKNSEIKHLFDNCPKLSPPSTLKRIKSEEKIAYVLASYSLGDGTSRDVIHAAFRDFLRYKIPICAGANRQGFGLLHDIPLWMHVYRSVVPTEGLCAFDELAAVFEFVDIEQ